MSLPIAIRSAVFYFAACTPCAQARHQQKAKTQARKERKEAEKRELEESRLETTQPGRYQHPAPWETNSYWNSEIEAGPRPPPKGKRKDGKDAKDTNSKNSSQRRLTSSGRNSSAHPSVIGDNDVQKLNSHSGDGVAISQNGDDDDEIPYGWNTQPGYQREDEVVWGVQWSGHKIMGAFTKARDSAGRMIDATLGLEKVITDDDRRSFYSGPVIPPVNEYHPPIVANRAPIKEAHRWMLQPPPSAKIMEGKVPVNRAASSGSKSSGRTLVADDQSLGRLAHENLAKERLKNEGLTETELIDSLFQTRSNRSLSFPRSRSLSLDGSEESLERAFSRGKRSRLAPVAAPPGMSSDDDDDDPIPMPAAIAPPTARVARRPNLETIQSSGSFASSRKSSRRTRRQDSHKMTPLSRTRSPVGDDSD